MTPLPASLLPLARPVTALMGMEGREFLDLYVGDGKDDRDDPEQTVVDAMIRLAEERAHALVPEWMHRQATIDVVECFCAVASSVASLDRAVDAVSTWLADLGSRASMKALGMRHQAAEGRLADCEDRLADDYRIEGNPVANHREAVAWLDELRTKATLHLLFREVRVSLGLMADRIRVVVDLGVHGRVDMGGHHWDGDKDREPSPTPSPLVVA